MSIRLRLAAMFTFAAAVLFAVGAFLFDTQLSSGLLSTVDSQLRTALSQASSYFAQATSSEAENATPLPGEFLVQLIDPKGVVNRASRGAGKTPLVPLSTLNEARRRSIAFTSTSDGEAIRVLAVPYRGHAGWVEVASATLETYDRAQSDVFRELLIGGLLFVAIAGLGSYYLARAALSPVERLRREVAALSEREDDTTVQVPGTRDEIAALATTMNTLLVRLKGALARQRAFVADASHELRTPFAVLRGELELASRDGRTREELVAAIKGASEEADRLNRLTESLLLLARSDSDQFAVRKEPTDLEALLRRSEAVARARAEQAGVRVRVEVTPGLIGTVDPDRIRQAVDNLVDNAIRFAPHGSDVVVRARSAAIGDGVVIEVEDAGLGFPADFLPHAFERFHRPDSGRARSDGGAGLGLAIVRAIALAHGGRAIARNRASGGAIVVVELPGSIVDYASATETV